MINVSFVGLGFTSGGIGRTASLLINELAKSKEIRPFIVSYSKDKREELYRISYGIQRDYLLEKHTSMFNFLLRGGIFKLRNYLIKNNISIVVACGVLYYPLVVLAAKLAGVKSVCWEHTCPETSTNLKFHKIIRYVGGNLSTANVLISKDALEFYNEHFKCKKNHIIYNPIDPQLENISSDYNRKSNKIITVGRLTDQKNYPRLLRIAKIVLEKHTQWKWDIYGDGEQRRELEDKIIELDLAGRVQLKGNVRNIYEVYKDYSFLVMTSKYEGFPMVLLEGASIGLPLISFDIKTGPSEIIIHQENGLLCDKDSDVEMITAIDTLIRNEGLRCRFSEKIKLATRKYEISHIVRKWHTLIMKIITD